MTSFSITISPHRRTAARFIVEVRRAIQQALTEEFRARGLTQAEIARILKVHRSVINREIRGDKDLTVGRIGELAHILGRRPQFALPRRQAKVGTASQSTPLRASRPVAAQDQFVVQAY
jgi:plasmid maintenance system antidote protein VapI